MLIKLHVHASKESAWDAGEKAGLSDKAVRMFRHAGTDHEIGYEVNPETGIAVPVTLDGRAIATEKTK